MSESETQSPEPGMYWCCNRCAVWARVDVHHLCEECASTIRDLTGRKTSLRANLVMFDGEEP